MLWGKYKAMARKYEGIEKQRMHYTWANFHKMNEAFRVNINHLEPIAIASCLDKINHFQTQIERYHRPDIDSKQADTKLALDMLFEEIKANAYLLTNTKIKIKQIHA